MVRTSVYRTSSTEARTVSVRSVRMPTSTPWGRLDESWGNSSFTASATLITLAPGCRWTLTRMARLPPAQPASCAFSTPSTTWPTSARRMGAPFLKARTRGRNEAAWVSWSFVASAKSWRGPSMLPLGWLTLAETRTCRTSSSESPVPARATGSTCTRTAGFCPPLMVTRPTPETCEIFCARMESAASSTLSSGSISELTARVRMGVSAGLDLL